MTYIELNDEYDSIIDTKEIKSMSVDINVLNNLYYIKIHYRYENASYSYKYRDLVTLCKDQTRIKIKLGF